MNERKYRAYGWKICLINIIKKADLIDDYIAKIMI